MILIRPSIFLVTLLVLICGHWLSFVQSQTCQAGDNDESCTASAETAAVEDACQDQNERCGYWASVGECANNPGYMLTHCQKSCDHCGSAGSKSANNDGNEAISFHEGGDLGVPQVLDGADLGVSESQSLARILEARKYVDTKVRNVMNSELNEMCKNEHELCTVWAILGECDNNPTYMKKSCAPVCNSCDYLTVEGRCPLDPNAPEAWGPGDLDKMFRRLSSEPLKSKYDTQVLSSPDIGKGGPWVITMENIVTEEEALRLIELGATEGYERSTDVGKIKGDGTFEKKKSTTRTSTNAWCQNDCYEDEMAQNVIHRISNLTQINETNSEYLQLLRYTPGQFYREHHDYISHEVKRQQGPRILTVYLYLNDVEAGGGTNFPGLDLTVMPKRGRALLWPSVVNDRPDRKDHRTNHQALDVEAGVKYGANAWFHLRDFKTPNRNHCM